MGLKVYRQGDVLLIPTDLKNRSISLSPQQGRLIRRGEHGGRHEVSPESYSMKNTRIWVSDEGTKFLKAPGGAEIVHGEHHTLKVPKGEYEVRIQREVGEHGAARPRYVVD